MIRPIRAMTRSMLDFARSAARSRPHHPCRKTRADEIGVAERELADDAAASCSRRWVSRKHLADLGLAVSKINHDMRNILASAQLDVRPFAVHGARPDGPEPRGAKAR
jgi:hypothetical protein